MCCSTATTNETRYCIPCSDPQKNHIAKRTVYLKFCDILASCSSDTTTETFDKNGRLMSVTYQPGVAAFYLDFSRFTHYFTYDSRGRITKDTGIYSMRIPEANAEYCINYAYPDKRSAVVHTNAFGKRSITNLKFNKRDSIISLLEITESGDSAKYIYTNGDTTFLKSWERPGYLGALTIIDSVVTIKRPNTTYIYTKDNKQIWWWSPVAAMNYYDNKHRLIAQLRYNEANRLCDSTAFKYDNDGHLISQTLYYFEGSPQPRHIHREEFKYNNGLLTEHCTWRENDPDNVRYYYRYTYNEKGLQTKMICSQRYGNSDEMILWEEVWEYEYW